MISDKIKIKWLQHYFNKLHTKENVEIFENDQNPFCFEHAEDIPFVDMRVLLFSDNPSEISDHFTSDEPGIFPAFPTTELYADTISAQLVFMAMDPDADGIGNYKITPPFAFRSHDNERMFVLDMKARVTAHVCYKNGYFYWEHPHGLGMTDQGHMRPVEDMIVGLNLANNNDQLIAFLETFSKICHMSATEKMKIISKFSS